MLGQGAIESKPGPRLWSIGTPRGSWGNILAQTKISWIYPSGQGNQRCVPARPAARSTDVRASAGSPGASGACMLGTGGLGISILVSDGAVSAFLAPFLGWSVPVQCGSGGADARGRTGSRVLAFTAIVTTE